MSPVDASAFVAPGVFVFVEVRELLLTLAMPVQPENRALMMKTVHTRSKVEIF